MAKTKPAKSKANRRAQIDAAETALKMARQTAKSAKARVRALKSELKTARKHHKQLRKRMRAAAKAIAHLH